MHAQVSASDADAASFADRELFRGQAAWGAMHLPHARCLCGNAFSFSRARPPTRSDDLRAWTKAPMRMRRDETATWEQAGGGALRNGALASYLPTVWLASCLIRLNCFFILNGAAISAERPASLRRNDAASKKEQKEERKGKTCHKKKKREPFSRGAATTQIQASRFYGPRRLLRPPPKTRAPRFHAGPRKHRGG